MLTEFHFNLNDVTQGRPDYLYELVTKIRQDPLELVVKGATIAKYGVEPLSDRGYPAQAQRIVKQLEQMIYRDDWPNGPNWA